MVGFEGEIVGVDRAGLAVTISLAEHTDSGIDALSVTWYALLFVVSGVEAESVTITFATTVFPTSALGKFQANDNYKRIELHELFII